MQPVFIGGYPKSGTTLLTTLLDGHSRLLVLPEETFFLRQAATHDGMNPLEAAKWLLTNSPLRRLGQGATDDRLDGVSDYRSLDFSYLSERFLEQTSRLPQGMGDVLETFAACFADVTQQHDRVFWIEKTPGNEQWLTHAVAWYPHLRAIYVVRDPRDVYVSYARKKLAESNGRKILPLEYFLNGWSLSVWAWRDFERHHAQTLCIRFEDLVQQPEATMNQVCEFLEIEPEDSLRSPTKYGQHWSGNSMHDERYSAVSQNPVGRWKSSLAVRDLELLETYVGQTMHELGYALHTDVPTPTRLARVWLCQTVARRHALRLLARTYWSDRSPAWMHHWMRQDLPTRVFYAPGHRPSTRVI